MRGRQLSNSTDTTRRFRGVAEVPQQSPQVHQQLLLTDDSTLQQCSHTIWTPTEGLQLLASRGPKGGLPALTLSRRFIGSGSQRVPLLTAHETLWQGRCWS